MPGAVKNNLKCRADAKIEKRLLHSKAKRSSCVCFCAMWELSVQCKLVRTPTFGKQGFQIQMEVR